MNSKKALAMIIKELRGLDAEDRTRAERNCLLLAEAAVKDTRKRNRTCRGCGKAFVPRKERTSCARCRGER